jgi:hypothetical protein
MNFLVHLVHKPAKMLTMQKRKLIVIWDQNQVNRDEVYSYNYTHP